MLVMVIPLLLNRGIFYWYGEYLAVQIGCTTLSVRIDCTGDNYADRMHSYFAFTIISKG